MDESIPYKFRNNTNRISDPKAQNLFTGIKAKYVSSIGVQLDDPTNNYWTLPLTEMYRPGIEQIQDGGYPKFTDFRNRQDLQYRRFDGAQAAINGTVAAAAAVAQGDFLGGSKQFYISSKYAAAGISKLGAYTVFNLSAPGQFGYGWGDHGTPSLIKDFTLQTNVSTRWIKSKSAWRPKIENIAIPFRGDKVNAVDFGKRDLSSIYLWKPRLFTFKGPALKAAQNIVGSATNLTKDFIKFYFTGPSLHNGNKNDIDDIIVFRATINSLEDTFSPNWEDVQMIGRADPNYQYNGFNRSMQLGFDIYATSRDELKPIWRKLNALAGYTTPTYDTKTIGLIAPWMRITIGDLLVQQPVLIDSLGYTLSDADTTWEINIEEDPEMKQVPKKISVSLGLKVITEYLPEKNGQFYTLSSRNDEFGSKPGTDNWLSDTTTVKHAENLRTPPITT